jgi:Na+/citrate or Na+/malate symporter
MGIIGAVVASSMSLLGLVILLIAIGVGLWALNTYAAAIIDPKILTIINVVVVGAVIVWLLYLVGLLPIGAAIPVPKVQ